MYFHSNYMVPYGEGFVKRLFALHPRNEFRGFPGADL
jgi:hypothetical protein